MISYLRKQPKSEKEAESSISKLEAIIKESGSLSRIARNEKQLLSTDDVIR